MCATHEKLISLQATPQAFAHINNSLLVGSSTRLHTVDLNHPSVLVTARMSNVIHNILIHQQAPTVRILEVSCPLICDLLLPRQRLSKLKTSLSYVSICADVNVK